MKKRQGLRRSALMWCVFVVIGFAMGCNRIYSYKGYEIPAEISERIWKLESDFCTSVIQKDTMATLSYLNDSVTATFDKNNLTSAFYPIGRFLMDYPLNVQSIYYQKATLDHPLVSVRFDDEEIKPFEIRYISNSKESAVTTSILGDEQIQSCLLMLFGRYSNEWKILNLQIGYFLIEGKDASEWLKEAEKWIDQKDYAMASYCTRMCGWIIKPGADFWHYDNETEMLDKMEKLNRKIRRYLKPPAQLAEIATKPEINDIHAIISNNKVYPGFVYNTKLALDDSLGIEKECSQLDVVFASYFKNMDHDTIFVKVVHQEDAWVEPTTYLIKKRKLDKGLLTN